VATTYEQIAQSYTQFEEPDSALWYFRMAYTLNLAMNNRLTVAALHCDLAKVYDRLGDRQAAEKHLEEGVSLAHEVSVKHTSALYAFGRDFYDKLGEPAKALIFARLNEKLLDSINRNEIAMELLRFQAQLSTSRQERELEATRLKLRNRTISLVSFVAVAILSVTFMVVFYVQQRRIRRQNSQLNVLNQEQRALAQEIHHRVKNNLQYIVSLLNIQTQTLSNPDLATQIEEIKNRIVTMGVIHQRLYKGQDVSRIDVSSFVQELVVNLLSAFPSRAPLTKTVEIDSLLVDADTAIALGLLINELLTNAMKHALVNHPSPQLVLLLKAENGGLVLTLKDNGPGFQFGSANGGFGTRLIALLLRKLKGTVQQPEPNLVVIRMDGLTK
jgi:two-component sensor histidine kinase